MIQLRPFRNTDPPHLAEVWRSQPPERGRMHPVSTAMLEMSVFSKPYFDRNGLVVALQDGRPIGFAHAGFGPSAGGAQLDTTLGITHLVMTHAGIADARLEDDLLRASEGYLRSHGAASFLGGGAGALSGFYLGLIGGSQAPGVLDSDHRQADLYIRNGYQPHRRLVVLQRDLARFRPPVTRTQRQLRRELTFETIDAPKSCSWWEACVMAGLDRTRFTLSERRGGAIQASVSIWDVEPLASSWGLRTAGVFDLWVAPNMHRQGLATYLLSETYALLRKRGYALVEAQIEDGNAAAIGLSKFLGMSVVDHGTVFRKNGDG